MTAAQERLVCTQCLLPCTGSYGHTFLGLRKWSCPRCRHPNEWPLSQTREIVYWCIAGLVLIGAISVVVSGGVPVPGVLFVLIVVALVMNQSAKSQLRSALRRAEVEVVPPLSEVPPPIPMVVPAQAAATGEDAERLSCARCLLPFVGYWEMSFIGLRRWPCPRCRAVNEWPMTYQREVGLWVLAVGTIFFAALMVGGGMFPVPGLVTLGLAVLLIVNHGAKKRLREVQARAASALAAHPPPDQNRMV